MEIKLLEHLKVDTEAAVNSTADEKSELRVKAAGKVNTVNSSIDQHLMPL